MKYFSQKLTLAALWLLGASIQAATYDVGPGHAKTQLRDVSWENLLPGDVVNIHCKPGGYHEIILLSQSGTADQHIVVRGIADPVTGELPILDGQDAIMDPNIHLFTPILRDAPGLIMMARSQKEPFGYSPSYIDIESLEIRNAHTPYQYTDDAGVVHAWGEFVSGINIEHSHYTAIRHCNIHSNGLGIFANSKYGELGNSTKDILIEHNWIHNNGNIGSSSTHNLYIESVGAIYQYNVIGPALPGSYATNIKDRSSGTVVRCNTFVNSGGNYMIMFDDAGTDLQPSQPNYTQSFVYGNTFFSTNGGSNAIVLYGGDQPSYDFYRHGTLFFYQNTVINQSVYSAYNKVAIFEVPGSVVTLGAPMTEVIDARNNIFASLPVTPGGTPADLVLLSTDVPGTLNLGVNWVSPGTQLSSSPATVTGAENLIYGNLTGENNPDFLNASMRDFRLLAGARSVDAAGPLAAAVASNTFGVDFSPTEEIGPPLSSHPRVVLGAAADLGAYESDGAVAAVGAGAAALPSTASVMAPPTSNVSAAGGGGSGGGAAGARAMASARSLRTSRSAGVSVAAAERSSTAAAGWLSLSRAAPRL